jgi:hypothetical protein
MTEHPGIANLEAELARKNILLRAAYDLLKRSTQNHFVEEAAAILVQYDGANCDGSCLMDDIKIELDLPDRTQPIPLLPEQP